MTDDRLPRDVFWEVWRVLCARFRQEEMSEQGEMYYRFLARVMSEERFRAAARTLWATREFFPRPIDFVICDREREWRSVLESLYGPEQLKLTLYKRLSTAAREAIESLGGLSALSQMRTDRARSAFRDAYETHWVNVAYESELHAKRIEGPRHEIFVQLPAREGGGTMSLDEYLQKPVDVTITTMKAQTDEDNKVQDV